MNTWFFRFLVFVSFSANLTWVFSRDLLFGYMDEDMRLLLGADGYGSVLPYADIVFWVILLAGMTCYVGLFCYRQWSLYLLMFLDLAVLVVLAPFAGVEVSSPLERVARTYLLMSDGAILCAAFFTDLRIRFGMVARA